MSRPEKIFAKSIASMENIPYICAVKKCNMVDMVIYDWVNKLYLLSIRQKLLLCYLVKNVPVDRTEPLVFDYTNLANKFDALTKNIYKDVCKLAKHCLLIPVYTSQEKFVGWQMNWELIDYFKQLKTRVILPEKEKSDDSKSLDSHIELVNNKYYSDSYLDADDPEEDLSVFKDMAEYYGN